MKHRFADVCYHARKSAGLSIEKAAELIGCSPRMLNYYEAGSRTVPDDKVCKMVQVYDSHELGYVYLSEETCTGKMILPKIQPAGISSRTLRLRISLRQTAEAQRILEDIAADDCIDENEKTAFSKCLTQIKALAGACIGLGIFRPNRSIKKSALAEANTELNNKF